MGGVFIVGNGPSATRYKLGKEIDAADVVVRLNDFKTKGFEPFVGSKTTLLFTCRLNEYIFTLGQFPEVILCLLMNPLDGVTIPEDVINSPNISERIDWPEIDILTKWLPLAPHCYPSTGLLCVLKMVKRFGHVTVVGFDHFTNGNGHYYENGHRLEPTRHDGPGEAAIFKLLNIRGLLSFGGDQSFKYQKFDGHAPFITEQHDT